MSTELQNRPTSVNTPIFQPTSYEDMMRFAGMLAKSAMVPSALKGKPEDVFLTIQRGAEVGLSPFASVENIAVINGRTSMWGDALLALVKNSKQFEYIKEELVGKPGTNERGYQCTVKRHGEPEHVITFTVDDAIKAGLWKKPGPWTQYPQRMCQMRARSFALRDTFPDILRGLISTEEASDYTVVGSASTYATHEKRVAITPMEVVEEPIGVVEEEIESKIDISFDPKTGEVVESDGFDE